MIFNATLDFGLFTDGYIKSIMWYIEAIEKHD